MNRRTKKQPLRHSVPGANKQAGPRLRVRRNWGSLKPTTRLHSKGKSQGYNRSRTKHNCAQETQ
jgi:hypothetical protein